MVSRYLLPIGCALPSRCLLSIANVMASSSTESLTPSRAHCSTRGSADVNLAPAFAASQRYLPPGWLPRQAFAFCRQTILVEDGRQSVNSLNAVYDDGGVPH